MADTTPIKHEPTSPKRTNLVLELAVFDFLMMRKSRGHGSVSAQINQLVKAQMRSKTLMSSAQVESLRASIAVQEGVVRVCEENLAQGITELAGVDLQVERDDAEAYLRWARAKLLHST